MPKGWRVSLNERGRMRIFIVGLADMDAAKDKAISQCAHATGIVLHPLKDGEFEKLGLVDGQVIESAKIG